MKEFDIISWAKANGTKKASLFKNSCLIITMVSSGEDKDDM